MKIIMHAKKRIASRAEDDLEAGGYLIGHVAEGIIYVMDAVPVVLDDCSNVHITLGQNA